MSYFKICTVHLYYLYNEPTNALLINKLLYRSLLHCPYMFRRYCIIFRGARSQYLRSYVSIYKEQYNKLLTNCAFVVSFYK